MTQLISEELKDLPVPHQQSYSMELMFLCVCSLITTIMMNISSASLNVEAVTAHPYCQSYSSTSDSVTCQVFFSTDLMELVGSLPSEITALHVLGCRKPLSAGDIKSISPCLNITFLTLSRCHIVKLDSELFHIFPNLVEFHADGNHLTAFTASQLLGAKHLKVLNFSDNSLERIEEHALAEVRGLEVLDLSHNDLKSLPLLLFKFVPLIKELYLQNNQLELLPQILLGGLSNLEVLDLRKNLLNGLQAATFDNLVNLKQIYMLGNSLDCHCGLYQVLDILDSYGRDSILEDFDSLVCSHPEQLAGMTISTLTPQQFQCETPIFGGMPDGNNISISLAFMHSTILDCNATGLPHPSVYWITPGGFVAHPNFARWLPLNVSLATETLSYAGEPTFYKSSVHALENGSLQIHQLRNHFSGEYCCVVINPAGELHMVMYVELISNIQSHMIMSLFFGAVTMVGFLILSLMWGGFHLLYERYILKKKQMKLPDGTVFTVSEQDLEELDDLDLGSMYSSMYSLHWYSPGESPLKCVTPAEAELAEELAEEHFGTIRDTLEDARLRLRCGVERQVGRIRNRAAHVRNSSSRYMHTLRESGSRKLYFIRESGSKQLRSIRQSSSQYAHRVRAGVVLGVEQVKYHVQSMKELCGTGEISHTISTISVSTDVDSRRKTEVVRTVTYV